MKVIKLFAAVILLCMSQLTFAIGTQADIDAYNAAVAALNANSTQSQIDAAIDLAANANIAPAVAIAAITARGISATAVSAAIQNNMAKSSATACSPNCGTGTGAAKYSSDQVATINNALSTAGSSALISIGASSGTQMTVNRVSATNTAVTVPQCFVSCA